MNPLNLERDFTTVVKELNVPQLIKAVAIIKSGDPDIMDRISPTPLQVF